MNAVQINDVDFFQTLSWDFLKRTNPALQNKVYVLRFSSQEIFTEAFQGCGVTFAPDLLDLVKSSDPPSLDDFKNLPVCGKKDSCWGVYLLVLEKAGDRPKIYVGSGTAKKTGVQSRLLHYDTPGASVIPHFVQKAFDNGYSVSHKGLLCQMPIPSASERLTSGSKDYYMPAICPWERGTLQYDGCCSHSALYETVRGTAEGLELDAAELDAREAEREKLEAEKAGTRAVAYYHRNKDNEDFKLKLKVRAAKAWSTADSETKEKVKNRGAKYKVANLASGKHVCETCDLTFDSLGHLNVHKTSKRHIQKASGVKKVLKIPGRPARRARLKAEKRFYCSVCDYAADSNKSLEKHFTRQRHISKASGLDVVTTSA